MKRIVLVLGSVIVAIACGGGGGGETSPTSDATGWSGTATFSSTTSAEDKGNTDEWTATVFWIKDTEDNPETAPLTPGVITYKLGPGSTIKMTAKYTGACNGGGEKARAFKPNEGALFLNPNGTYAGYLKETEGFGITLACRGGSTAGFPVGNIGPGWLLIKGTVVNFRMQGKPGSDFDTSIGGITLKATGSWDFLQEVEQRR